MAKLEEFADAVKGMFDAQLAVSEAEMRIDKALGKEILSLLEDLTPEEKVTLAGAILRLIDQDCDFLTELRIIAMNNNFGLSTLASTGNYADIELFRLSNIAIRQNFNICLDGRKTPEETWEWLHEKWKTSPL